MSNTSSPKSYNYLALRGSPVDDMEYVETFNLDPNVAYTPKINEVMLSTVKQQNIDGGMDPAEAEKIRLREEKNIKKLMAMNGLLKK